MILNSKTWKLILGFAAIASLLTWLGYIAAFELFDATRPTKPDSERVIAQNNHGHIVYLTDQVPFSCGDGRRVLVQEAVGRRPTR